MADELNLFQRLQRVRKNISKKDIKKTGEAKYKGQLKYTYFELSDILPVITEECDKNNIVPVMDGFNASTATLKVYDALNPEKYIEFSMSVKICQLIGCNDMQNVGGSYSYAKRYLYMNAFEISEDRDITEQLGDEPGAQDCISNVHVKVIKDLIEKTHTDEIAFLTWANVKEVKDITNRDLPSVLNQLNKKLEQMQKKGEIK